MSKACQGVSKACPRHVQSLSKACPRVVQGLPKACPRACRRHTEASPRFPQGVSKDLPKAFRMHAEASPRRPWLHQGLPRLDEWFPRLAQGIQGLLKACPRIPPPRKNYVNSWNLGTSPKGYYKGGELVEKPIPRLVQGLPKACPRLA
jgi:hypothetical protein